jgi:cyanobactin maturation PatA/PatG family protease
MNDSGEPLPFSNWGDLYQSNGILAPGENILVAGPRGGAIRRTGTIYAAAIVSGVAALLLSLQKKRCRRISPSAVRAALLQSALGCNYQKVEDCRRLLAGRLNIRGARSLIMRGSTTMLETSSNLDPGVVPSAGELSSPAPPAAPAPVPTVTADSVQPSSVQASGCGCACGVKPQLVYALGQLGYALVSEARLDYLVQKMAGQLGITTPERVLAFDTNRLLAYFEQNPWDAAAVEWTLSLDGTPIYAIRPEGAFAGQAFGELRRFLRDRIAEGAERISIPGRIVGKATLFLGQVVPVIAPDLRGMYSWTTAALVSVVVGPAPAAEAPAQEKEAHALRHTGVRNFLDRVYHELRNLGAAPHDRAINFAATNAFEIEKVYESALKEKMELESINVSQSPICRPGSDCWDVDVYFFYPERQVQTVRKVYRFTVDVSDIVPVTVGPMRSWFTR